MLELILGIILGALIYYKVIKSARYWEERGVTYVTQWAALGNLWDVIAGKKHVVDITCEMYKEFPNDRYIGLKQFGKASLLIRDLDLIKQIGVKEFDHFPDHSHLFSGDMEPLFSKSLLHLHGDQWKQMRVTISPAFTSSKMKFMYHLMSECAEDLAKFFQEKGEVDVEMKDLCSKFATNVIATTAFGIKVDAVRDPNDEFYAMGKTLTDIKPIQLLKGVLLQFLPIIIRLFRIRIFPASVDDFFTKIVKSNIRGRLTDGIVRPDLIHILLEAQKGQLKHDVQEGKDEGFAAAEESDIGKHVKQMELTDDHIVAQALLFFFAGFETVSSASCLIAHELAANPDVQKKLQDEIDEVAEKYGEKVPYEALVAMNYLDQVVSETLRMWPPGFQTDRYCVKEFTIQPKNSREGAVLVEKGMPVVLSIMGIHRDPQYFPDPDRFDPERFNDENRSKIVPGSYMPFGVGPRNCIGSRFALLEMKILFFHLLSKFDLVPNEKTVIPLKFDPRKVTMTPKGGFQLRLKPRQF